MADERREGTSRLVSEEGKIVREQIFTEDKITIRFRRAILSPDGEIQQVEINKAGTVIGLTAAQALSLAKEINRRLG